jgi:hypothetical protein
MKYSIVIPSLASVTAPYLKLCVESLRASGFDGEIIVVTNGTSIAETLNIKGISRRLHTRTQGQCNAVNIGASVVTTEYMMVSNDDMYYAPGWDKNLRFDYPVFSPNLVEPTNNPGSAKPFLKFNGGFDLDEFGQDVVNNYIITCLSNKNGNFKQPSMDKIEQGFNLPFFIKKDLWDFLKGYDTAYDPWGSNSDTDLQTRIDLAGVTPMRLRDVLVYHFSNKSGTFDGTHQDFYQNNIEYFKSKFGFDRDELGSDVWYNKDMLPKDPSKIKYKQKKYET